MSARATFQASENFYAFEPGMEEGFIRSSAIVQQGSGTHHNVAMPNWTVVPMLYHAPPDYDMKDQLDAHGGAIMAGLAAMRRLEYYEAVEEFDRALLEAGDAPIMMGLWIQTHRGHALLRAALLQSPALHGQETRRLLQMSAATLAHCVDALAAGGSSSFGRSLVFSASVGLAWTSFFRGDVDATDKYLAEALAVSVDPSHLRAGAQPGIDTKFLQIALGAPTDLVRFGHLVSDYYEDSFLVDLLDIERQQLKGNSAFSITLIVNTILNPKKSMKFVHLESMKPPHAVVEFMDRLEAGYAGNVWLAVGAVAQARVAYEYAYASGSVLLRAAALVGLGNVYSRLSDIALVRGSYLAALEIYDELGFREGQTLVHCNLGNLYLQRQQRTEALEHYKIALGCVMKPESGSAALHLQLKFAELHIESGDFDEAEKSLDAVSRFRPSKDDLLAHAWIHNVRGNFFLKKGLMAAANGKFKKRIAKQNLIDATQRYAEIQRRVGTAGTESLWFTIFEQHKGTYARLLWCLAELSSDDDDDDSSAVEALVWCERSRSRTSGSRATMSASWDRFLNVVSDDEAAVRAALSAMPSRSFDALTWRECWDHLLVLLSRCKLPAATAVVEYALCADFGLLIFVLEIPGGHPKMRPVSFQEQDLDMERLTALVDKTVRLVDPGTPGGGSIQVEQNLATLYDLLIKPVERWLQESQQIIVIPHEVLFRVPFHALMKPDREGQEKEYLIQRHTLSYEESIRSLLQRSLYWEERMRHLPSHLQPVDYVQDDHTKSDSKLITWLVVGIDKHEPFERNLKEAEREAEAVAGLLAGQFRSNGTGHTLLGSLATKQQVLPQFYTADIIHLATHGKISAKYERGGIRLAVPEHDHVKPVMDDDVRPTQSIDRDVVRESAKQWRLEAESMLSATEISRMELKARLVVLSACQSADGVILGDGVAGLGRALLQAEVPCTMLSLWPVSDKSTIDFMTRFYQGLTRGRSVADAMRTAMISMITAVKERSNSKYGPASSKRKAYTVGHWAPFCVLGLPIVHYPAPGLMSQVMNMVPQLVLGSVGVVVGSVFFAKKSKSKDLTRSSCAKQAYPVHCYNHTWNPLQSVQSATSTLPLGHLAVILGLIIFFHLIYERGQTTVAP